MVNRSLTSESLWNIGEGTTATVVSFADESGLAKRFLALGIRVGSELNITQRRLTGMVVRAGGTRIALSQGMAAKLIVIVAA